MRKDPARQLKLITATRILEKPLPEKAGNDAVFLLSELILAVWEDMRKNEHSKSEATDDQN